MAVSAPSHTSSERLARIATAFEADIEKGIIPGAVTLVAHRGKVAYLEAFGFRNREDKLTMATDSIFRIASMTKPMVSLAIMMLVEEGRIRLVNPVSTYLPEMKNLQVGVEKTLGAGNRVLILVPAHREMSVQDLLRHTSGMNSAVVWFGSNRLAAR